MNIQCAKKVLECVISRGCTDFVVCPGARNSPYVELVDRLKGINKYSHFDERGASFFALGKLRAHKKPVAVIVTSGTAVAECLPAVIEAYYQEVPLIIISADRPKKLRGSGAPQSIEQAKLLSDHCELCLDLNPNEELTIENWSGRAPLHINTCFDEPLLDEELSEHEIELEKGLFQVEATPLSPGDSEWLKQTYRSLKDPLVIVGGLNSERERSSVYAFLKEQKLPIYAEATSGLRDPRFRLENYIISGEKRLEQLIDSRQCQSVIRIGSVPTVKVWRILEYLDVPVLSLSESPFSGMSHGNHIFARIDQALSVISKIPIPPASNLKFLVTEVRLTEEIEGLYKKYPESEQSLVRKMASKQMRDSLVYLGNSLPIRVWDLVTSDIGSPLVYANRGANGIDGQIASFLGLLNPEKSNYCILGDLTALYDINSLALIKQAQVSASVVVINNKGGRIFERLFTSKSYLNEHNIEFSKFAEAFGLEYRTIKKQDDIQSSPPSVSCIVEVLPDNQQSRNFWNEYKELFS